MGCRFIPQGVKRLFLGASDMIHQYKLNGYNIVLDIYSGSIHCVDEPAYDAIGLYEAAVRNTGGDLSREGRENIKQLLLYVIRITMVKSAQQKWEI